MLTIESLLEKIREVRRLCIFNILTTLFSMSILLSLEINMMFFSALIYLFALYLICLFITNGTIDKYGLKKGKFDMDRHTFVSFFNKGTQLRFFLISLLPIVIIAWLFVLFKLNLLTLSLSFFDILFFLYISVFIVWSIKEMINSFITTIFLTRVIDYACLNDLIQDK